MKQSLSLIICWSVCGLLLVGPVFANDQDKVVVALEEHIAQLETSEPEARQQALKAIEELKTDSATDAVTEALMILYADYANAIESTDEDDISRSVELLSQLTEADDKFLAADAAFYLARTLMNNEQFETALPLLKQLGRELSEHSAHLPTVQYYQGVAQAGLLKNEEAINSFMEFLQFNQDAPERLRVNAWRQVQELQAIGQGKMEQVHQRMDYSRRRLKLTESGEETQVEQDKIIKLLSEMIKEQQKKECSNCNSKKPSNKKQQQQGSPKSANRKPNQSQSQQGGTSSNPNGSAVKKNYDDSPSSPWSRLRDRSRDPANNAIKEKLPARYRDIVERYYEAANGNKPKK